MEEKEKRSSRSDCLPYEREGTSETKGERNMGKRDCKLKVARGESFARKGRCRNKGADLPTLCKSKGEGELSEK